MAYALNVRLENLVRAYLSGFLRPVKEPSKEKHLRDTQGVDPHSAVMVGTYHVLSTDILISSTIRSACALQGVKAQDILDALLKMRLVVDGEDYPVVTVDKKSGMTSPAVCSLEAVYVACQYVLDVKCQRDYKDIVAAKKHKKETKATNVVKFANKTH